MFEDKETETEMLAGELDRTRDIVSALQDENRELKVFFIPFRLRILFHSKFRLFLIMLMMLYNLFKLISVEHVSIKQE